MKGCERIISLLLVTVMLLLSLAACTGGSSDADTTTEGSAVVDPGTQNNDKKVTVNGISLEEIKISVKKKSDNELAAKIQEIFKQYNSYSVPIVSQDELSGDEKLVICLGTFDREKTNPLSSTYKGYRIVVTDNGGYTVGIIGSNDTYYKQAVDRFIEEMKVTAEGDNVSIALPAETISEYSYTFEYGAVAQWVMDPSKTVEEKISDGITYKEYYYTDGEDDKYIANVLYVDTDKYSFCLGLPSKDTAYQTVTEQMKNAVADGKKVVAGINGDRWDTWLGTGRIHGLSILDGELIDRGLWDGGTHNGQYLGDKPYLALTKNGEYVIGAKAGTANISNFTQAIGGDYVLVDRAVPLTNTDFKKYQPTDDNHLNKYHPRTLVGINDNGDLILVTIDGRQAHSNGASLEVSADLMASLGCYNAISLDGGGSTEMTIKYGEEYRIKNIPSDGQSRVVKNTLLIVEK